MKTTLTTTQAAHLLLDDDNANWSRAGAFALVEYLEELEEGCDVDIEFCPCSIRCDYSEYKSLEDWASDHFANHVQAVFELKLNINGDGKIEETDEEVDDQIRDYIGNRGQLIEFEGGIIVSSF